MSGLTCYVHPEATARDRCATCRRTICPVCVVEIANRTLCRSCADARASRRARIKRAMVAAGLTASAATLWFLFLRSPGDEKAAAPAIDAGLPQEMIDEMNEMRARLKADACDDEAAWKLGGVQNALGDYSATLALADRWVTACPESVAVRQAQLYALEKTGGWDQAVGITSELVSEQPWVADYWSWRADAEDGKGELEQAAFDYRQSLAITPNNAVVKFADLARRRGRPCEGVFALTRFIDLIATTRAWVHDMRHDLYVEGDCTVHLGRGSGALGSGEVVRATVGGAAGRFLVAYDQGHVVVTRAFATRARLVERPSPAVTVRVGGELTTAALADVDRIQVGPLSADGFEVAVVDAIGKGVDGVIGLDFLWRFEWVWQHDRPALRPLRITL